MLMEFESQEEGLMREPYSRSHLINMPRLTTFKVAQFQLGCGGIYEMSCSNERVKLVDQNLPGSKNEM